MGHIISQQGASATPASSAAAAARQPTQRTNPADAVRHFDAVRGDGGVDGEPGRFSLVMDETELRQIRRLNTTVAEKQSDGAAVSAAARFLAKRRRGSALAAGAAAGGGPSKFPVPGWAATPPATELAELIAELEGWEGLGFRLSAYVMQDMGGVLYSPSGCVGVIFSRQAKS